MGAQRDDPRGRNFDPGAQMDESPVHEVVLAPFFVSKYEMTQGQWLGFVGRNPSRDGPKASAYAGPRTLLNPVESVSLPECLLVLSRMGLVLPTEAQWEYAARAGPSSPWWTGSEPESLECAVNIADAHARAHGGSGWPGYELWLDDGATTHAPVGSYLPNAFGLHDVAGNVWEWCRDVYGAYELPVSPGDGERLPDDLRRRVYRGGGIDGVATQSRSADRTCDSSNYRLVALGLRPARPVEP